MEEVTTGLFADRNDQRENFGGEGENRIVRTVSSNELEG
jgi:hypothetical protein